MLWEGEGSVSLASRLNQCAPGQGITLVIGPEGGFTEAEVKSMLDAGAKKVSLGANILRIETAAVSLLARFRLD